MTTLDVNREAEEGTHLTERQPVTVDRGLGCVLFKAHGIRCQIRHLARLRSSGPKTGDWDRGSSCEEFGGGTTGRAIVIGAIDLLAQRKCAEGHRKG